MILAAVIQPGSAGEFDPAGAEFSAEEASPVSETLMNIIPKNPIATLPVSMEVAQRDLKVPEPISSFVQPLGATINMVRTAIMQGVATMFIAQAYGVDRLLDMTRTTVNITGDAACALYVGEAEKNKKMSAADTA